MLITPNLISEFNPQWKTGSVVPCEFTVRRKALAVIEPWLFERPALSITGLRRAGKSVLMAQLRDLWLNRTSLPGVRYLNFSFESEDELELLPAAVLDEVLAYYFKNILGESSSAVSAPVLITLDELQNVASWQAIVKRYYDLNPHIKFIISGSASLFLNDTAESLAGRLMEFSLPPLDFEEFSVLAGAPPTALPGSLEDLRKLPPRLVDAVRLKWFEKFLLAGGLPEGASMLSRGRSIAEVQSYINKSVVSKIIGKDLRKYFNIKLAAQDFQLFRILCHETGSPLNIQKLAEATGMAEDTLRCHLDVFEKAFLTCRLALFNPKMRRQMKAHPKLYISSAALAMSGLGESELPAGSLTGHLVESYVRQRLTALTQEVFYARDQSNREVDFFCPKEKLLIESKYETHLSAAAVEQLHKAAQKYHLTPIMITKDEWGRSLSEPVKMVPALYL